MSRQIVRVPPTPPGSLMAPGNVGFTFDNLGRMVQVGNALYNAGSAAYQVGRTGANGVSGAYNMVRDFRDNPNNRRPPDRFTVTQRNKRQKLSQAGKYKLNGFLFCFRKHS